MAPEHVSSRFMALRKEGTFPVNFFGDNEFSWCQGENMVSFTTKYDPQFKQKVQKQYKVSMHESCSVDRLVASLTCTCLRIRVVIKLHSICQ
jgi:hypothetical protein